MRNSGRGLLFAGGGGGGCSPQDCAGRSLAPAEARNSLCVRMRPPQAATRKHFINAHASAYPAAEAISDEGRPRRFFGYLLSEQKVTYEKSLREIMRFFEPRSSPPPPRGGLLSHSDRRRRTAHQKSKMQYAASHSSGPRNFAAQRRYLRRLAPLVRPPAAAEDKFYRITATRFRLVRVLRRRRTAGLRPEHGFVMPPDACGDRHRPRKGNQCEISCLKVRKIGQKVSRQRFFCFPLGAYAQLLLTLQ